METLPVLLNDDVTADVRRKYAQTKRLRQSLQDPALTALYQELASEDVALAEAGMGDYQ